MKLKFLTIMFLSFIAISLFAQSEEAYTAMILSLDGNGVLVHNSQKGQLEFPQRFVPGDVLTINSGIAIIMLFSGEEIPLSAVSNYTIPEESNAGSSEISELANNSKSGQSLLSQSGVAYQIRGISDVFPRNSKIHKMNNLTLRIGFENIEDLKLDLKLIDSKTQKVVYEKNAISDSIVSLLDVVLEEGKSYYWTLNNTPVNKPEMGTIIVPTSSKLPANIKAEELYSAYDYLNAFSAYYNNGYLFDAYGILSEAILKFPDYEVFELMLKGICSE